MLFSIFRFDSLHLPSTKIAPREDWPEGATLRTWFGQEVLWRPYTEDSKSKEGYNLSTEQLEPYRQIGDPALDSLLDRLEQEGRPLQPGDDFLELAETPSSNHLSPKLRQDLRAFVDYYRKLPSWVDLDQIRRGQEVFLTYSAGIGISLYYRSLVAGFSIPKIAAVILSTGYLIGTPKRVRTRLLDTGALLSACMTEEYESLLPDNPGWRAALYVRVLHAKVRRALLKRKTGTRKWDTETYGVPINQEDMAATLLAFSTNAICGLEFIAGMGLPRQEQLDYIALWRYIGWLLGVHTVSDMEQNCTHGALPVRSLDPCGPGWHATESSASGDSIGHSRAMLQSIIFHLLHPDKLSVSVSHHLLRIGRPNARDREKLSRDELVDEDEQDEYWFYLRALNCRRFIGDPLADALQLPLHTNQWMRIRIWWKSIYLLSLVRIWTLAAMMCRPLRRWISQKHLTVMRRFHAFWEESHPKRVAEELGKHQGIEAKRVGGDAKDTRSFCPFAMVAPPQ